MVKEQIKQEFYSSPEVEVIETQVQSVICQSNTEKPTDGTPGWDWEN